MSIEQTETPFAGGEHRTALIWGFGVVGVLTVLGFFAAYVYRDSVFFNKLIAGLAGCFS